MTDHCYQVEATGLDRNTLLGFATGDRADIEAYFEEHKAYGLILSLIVPKHIPAGYADSKEDLMKQKEELQRQVLDLYVTDRLIDASRPFPATTREPDV